MMIIVRHRRCLKSPHPHTNLNGGHVRHTFSNQLGNDRSVVTTTNTFLSSSNALSSNCTADTHEMQTLILTSSNDNVASANRSNGAVKKYDNVNSDNEETSQDASNLGLISSTPKTKHKTVNVNENDIVDESNDEHDGDTLSHVDEKRSTPLMGNGKQLKTFSPHNDLRHDNDQNFSRDTPAKKKKNDNKNNISKKPKSITSTSVFDSSQQKLLQESNENETNSSGSFTSSFENSYNNIDNRNKNDQNSNQDESSKGQQNSLSIDEDSNQSNPETKNLSTNSISTTSDLLKFNGVDNNSTHETKDDSFYQKRLPAYDYRRPIVGPNG